MIQVLERALRVLELLSTVGGEGRPLGEIAETVGLNKATCSHILKTLVAQNFAEQIAPRKGYRLGPMVYALAQNDGGFRPDLVRAAEPLIATLAREVRETVLLAVLRGDKRLTLCQVDGTQEVQVQTAPMAASNVYQLATGRLLLAYSGPEAGAAVVASLGWPGEQWDGLETADKLVAALAAIRREGRVIHVTPGHVVAVAYPIAQDGQVVAALGLYLPEYRFTGQHREAILAGLRRTATDISRQLTAAVVQAAGRP